MPQKEQPKNLLGVPMHKMLEEVSASIALELSLKCV